MLIDGLMFACEEEINAAYGIIFQDANQVSEWLHFWFRAVKKLHQDVILGFDWLQSVNLQVDWINYGVTFKDGFVAASLPVYFTVNVKLCSFKVLMHLLHAKKLENSWFTFVQQILCHQGLNCSVLYS